MWCRAARGRTGKAATGGDRVRASGEELGAPPEEQHDDEREGDQLQVFRAHPAPASASGRYVCRVICRRRHNRTTPNTISSTGTPMMLPYFTAWRMVTLVKTRGGGARFFERMPITASCLASPSTPVSTETEM